MHLCHAEAFSLIASIFMASLSLSSCLFFINRTRHQGSIDMCVWRGARSMADPIKQAQELLLAELKKSRADRDEAQMKELKEFLKLTQASGQYARLSVLEQPDAEGVQHERLCCQALGMHRTIKL